MEHRGGRRDQGLKRFQKPIVSKSKLFRNSFLYQKKSDIHDMSLQAPTSPWLPLASFSSRHAVCQCPRSKNRRKSSEFCPDMLTAVIANSFKSTVCPICPVLFLSIWTVRPRRVKEWRMALNGARSQTMKRNGNYSAEFLCHFSKWTNHQTMSQHDTS